MISTRWEAVYVKDETISLGSRRVGVRPGERGDKIDLSCGLYTKFGSLCSTRLTHHTIDPKGVLNSFGLMIGIAYVHK